MLFPVTFRVTLALLGTCAVTAVLPRIFLIQKPQGTGKLPPAASVNSGLPACDFGGQPYFFVAADEHAPFNVSPQAWDMRAFNSRCQPRPLVETLVDDKSSANRQISILLYGDRCCLPPRLKCRRRTCTAPVSVGREGHFSHVQHMAQLIQHSAV